MSAIKHVIFQPDKVNTAIQSMVRVNPNENQFQLSQFDEEKIEGHLQTQEALKEKLRLTEERLKAAERRNDLLQEHIEYVCCMQKNTLSEVTSSMAHELNQPLSAIRNYLSGCERRILCVPDHYDCDQKQLLKAIRLSMEQVERAAGIITHVRSFVGKVAVERATLDINRLIRETTEVWQMPEQNHAVHFKLILMSLPYTAVDRLQIFQVLVNLIMNAVESVRDKGVDDIELVIRSEHLDAHTVRVSVEDQGVGLPEEGEDIANMFKMFHNRKGENLAMGLPISRSIIEAHGGGIEAVANPAGGSIFRFTLPICEE